jgi:hypothetical protein
MRMLKLEKNGRTTFLKLITPGDARFEVSPVDAARQEFESPNPGVSAIRIHLSGDARIAVRLTMRPDDNAFLDQLSPADWK